MRACKWPVQVGSGLFGGLSGRPSAEEPAQPPGAGPGEGEGRHPGNLGPCGASVGAAQPHFLAHSLLTPQTWTAPGAGASWVSMVNDLPGLRACVSRLRTCLEARGGVPLQAAGRWQNPAPGGLGTEPRVPAVQSSAELCPGQGEGAPIHERRGRVRAGPSAARRNFLPLLSGESPEPSRAHLSKVGAGGEGEPGQGVAAHSLVG